MTVFESQHARWTPPYSTPQAFYASPISISARQQPPRDSCVFMATRFLVNEVSRPGSFFGQEFDFCMEVTDKTRQDANGGTLVSYDGRPRLLESALVPSAHRHEVRLTTPLHAPFTHSL